MHSIVVSRSPLDLTLTAVSITLNYRYGNMHSVSLKSRDHPKPKESMWPSHHYPLDDDSSAEYQDFPVTIFSDVSVSPVLRRTTIEKVGEESPTSVNYFNPSWEQYLEVFGTPFSKQAPEDIYASEEEATSPFTIVHLIPVDDGELSPKNAEENIYSSPASGLTKERESTTVPVIPAAPQKGQPVNNDAHYRRVLPDWDLAATLAMKEDYPSPERPVLKTPLLPKSLINIEIDLTEGMDSWKTLFENMASEITRCTTKLAAHCANVTDLNKQHSFVEESTRGSMAEENSAPGSVPAEKRARLGATPPHKEPSRIVISGAESFMTSETGSSFFQPPPPLKRISVSQALPNHGGAFPISDYDEVEDDIETVARLNNRHAHNKKSDLVEVVVSEDHVNLVSGPAKSFAPSTVLQLPKSCHLRLRLMIDEYDIRKYPQILKELVGNDQIAELDIRRARSRKMRHRTIHDLLSLFSVLETLPGMRRLYLQDFESHELELIPFEELLESNPMLSSLELRKSEVDSVQVGDEHVISGSYVDRS